MAGTVSEVMNALTHGVYILGVHTEEKDNLMTAAWLMQVSSAPAMIAVAVGSSHLTAELIHKSGKFSVSVLNQDQKELALSCGFSSGRKEDKLQKATVGYTVEGIPFVEKAIAQFSCKVTEEVTVTNHTLFLAEVTDAISVENPENFENVLLYHKKDFFN